MIIINIMMVFILLDGGDNMIGEEDLGILKNCYCFIF